MKNILCDYAKCFIGMKYIWGGDDASDGGFDCSGLVLECLRSVGLWDLSDTTAQGIYNTLKHKYSAKSKEHRATLEVGDILFFGPTIDSINHTAIFSGFGQMIEAGGGNATNKKGMVRKRLLTHRKDFIAFIKL
jgi:cell wall-associated NlpC family hydrolase